MTFAEDLDKTVLEMQKEDAIPESLPIPCFRVAVMRDDEVEWLEWMAGMYDSSGSDDTFAGIQGEGIVDVEFDEDTLGPNGWYETNVQEGKVVGLTVYYDTPDPEETGYFKAMYRVHWMGDNPAWSEFKYDDEDGGAGNDADQIDMIELTLSPYLDADASV